MCVRVRDRDGILVTMKLNCYFEVHSTSNLASHSMETEHVKSQLRGYSYRVGG